MTHTLLHVVNGLGFGGTERLCLSTVAHAPSVVRPVVMNVTSERQQLRSEFERLPGVTLVDSDHSLYERSQFVRYLKRFVMQHGIDGVLSYTFGVAHVVTAFGAQSAGVERIVACAGNTAPRTRLARMRWRLVLALSRAMAVPVASASTAIESSLLGLGVGLPSGSQVVHNGIDVDKFRPSKRERGAGPVVGMVARLDKIKDHLTLVRAFRRVVDREPAAKLRIIGEGGRRDRILEEVDRYDLRDSVVLLGNRHDVPEQLRELDVFAMSTTEAEGFGIALAEAMASGIPCVATNVAACREVLQGGSLGALVPGNDPETLADAILRVWDEPEAASALAERSRRQALRDYSAERCSLMLHEMVYGLLET